MLSKIETFFNLTYKHVSLPITFGGIELILIVTIFLTTYLKSWVFVVSIITVRFMVDQCPFLFKALTWSNNNTFPFQQHFELTCDLLLPLTHACHFPFEQLINQQMVWLQYFISKLLHHHTFSNMLFDEIFEAHCVQTLSCFDLGANTWFIIRPIFITFWLSSLVFFTMLGCVCTRPIDLMGIHFLRCTYNNEHTWTHDAIRDIFDAIAWNIYFHMKQEYLHAFHSITFNSFHTWIDIVLTKDEICTLVNVVITNPMCANLLPWSCTT
jgi:hypothetical protein